MKDSDIWVGIFGVAPHSDREVLQGAEGAYVNIIGFAYDRQNFIEKASAKMNAIGFYVFEYEDVATFEERRLANSLGPDFTAMRHSLNRDEPIKFGSFYSFDHADA